MVGSKSRTLRFKQQVPGRNTTSLLKFGNGPTRHHCKVTRAGSKAYREKLSRTGMQAQTRLKGVCALLGGSGMQARELFIGDGLCITAKSLEIESLQNSTKSQNDGEFQPPVHDLNTLAAILAKILKVIVKGY